MSGFRGPLAYLYESAVGFVQDAGCCGPADEQEVEVTMWYLALAMILVVLVGVLLAFASYALAIGLLGVLTGERFVRCPYCHRHGLVVDGRLHDQGCPPSAAHVTAAPSRPTSATTTTCDHMGMAARTCSTTSMTWDSSRSKLPST